VEAALSDKACTRLLNQIEVLTTLRDLRANGLEEPTFFGIRPSKTG
jgi:hypothetical protein